MRYVCKDNKPVLFYLHNDSQIRRQIVRRLREHFSEPMLAPPNSNSRESVSADEDFVH